MRLAVFSHKQCWPSTESPSGYATDGGFPFQMRALSELFDRTTVVVPCAEPEGHAGEVALDGHNLSIAPLTMPRGRGLRRKLDLGFWLLRNARVLGREVLRADAVHAPIPGDIGTIGMIMAFVLRKPLFVRHCGNWLKPVTRAEHFWKWFMEKFAGGNRVMLATGGGEKPPSSNRQVSWIFATTLSQAELGRCRHDRQLRRENPKKLIIVCRQDRKKGTGVVIESLATIRERIPGITLDVVGDGPALAEFREMRSRLGLDDCVTFHGKVDHDRVVTLLKEADLFCYPTSASEGFPKVVLEALACGLPVVTTGISVLPELIGAGGGLLLTDATPSTLADGVAGILSDRERYRRMSARAVETASQYSLEKWRDTIGDKLRLAWGELQAGRSASEAHSPENLKVCFLAGTLGRGGAERQLIHMLKALKGAGVRTRVLCLTEGEALEKEIRAIGIEVTWVGKSGWRLLRLLRIVRELRRETPDIVQSAHFYTNLYAAIAGRFLRITSIGAIRNDLTSELASNGILGWGQLHLPRNLIANSEFARQRAIIRGIRADSIHFVPNVVETNGSGTPCSRNSNRNGSARSQLQVLFAARLTDQKRPDRFLQALRRIAERRPDLDFRATIAGDGPLRAGLESLTATLGLSNCVEFRGELADLTPLFARSDLMVLTSDWEGTPNVLLEAMGYGVPVVATNVGGVSGLVCDGVTGLLADIEDDSVADSIQALMENPELRNRLGESGRQFVLEGHSSVRLAQSLMEIYREMT